MNHVTLMGHLGGDPALKYTTAGLAICEFSLAVTERWRTESGEQRERTFWGRCYVFGPRGEAFAEYHKKGDKALVQGRLQTEQWEEKDTGKKRSATRIRVDQWFFVNGRPPAASHGPDNSGAQPAAHSPRQPESPGEIPGPPEEDDVPF